MKRKEIGYLSKLFIKHGWKDSTYEFVMSTIATVGVFIVLGSTLAIIILKPELILFFLGGLILLLLGFIIWLGVSYSLQKSFMERRIMANEYRKKKVKTHVD